MSGEPDRSLSGDHDTCAGKGLPAYARAVEYNVARQSLAANLRERCRQRTLPAKDCRPTHVPSNSP